MLTRTFDLGVVKRKLLFKKGATMVVTSSAGVESSLDLTELGVLDVTPGTATASKALVLDASKGIATITTATITTLTSSTVTAPVHDMTGTTGNQEIRLTANLADALSIEDTTGDFVVFDSTTSALAVKFDKAVQVNLGTSASVTGSGFPLSATRTAALQIFSDDNNAAISSGTLTRAGRFRNLQTYTGGNREQEAVGAIGQIVSVAGTNRHNMAGLMGSYEGSGALTVDGQASSTDPWIQAGVIGRVGVGNATTTVNANGVLAGVAAMSNTTALTNNGVYAGFYAGKWGGLVNFSHGLYIDAYSATIGATIANLLTPGSGRLYNALVLGGPSVSHNATGAGQITMANAATQHVDPMVINYDIIGSAPTNASTVNGIYQLLSHTTTNMSYLRLKGCDWTLDVKKHIQDAYTIQGELDLSTNSITVSGEACAMGLTTSVTSAVTGNVWNTIMVFSTDQTLTTAANLFLSNRGTGTIPHALYIEANSGTTVTNAIYLNAAGTVTNFIKFAAAGGGSPVTSSTEAAQNSTFKIRVMVGATVGYIPVIASGS